MVPLRSIVCLNLLDMTVTQDSCVQARPNMGWLYKVRSGTAHWRKEMRSESDIRDACERPGSHRRAFT